MTQTPIGIRRATGLALLVAATALLATLGWASPVAAQSGGCVGGPFEGATPIDSDGDGVNDADELLAGTDECDPGDAPDLVCGELVAGYDPTTADTDGDGFTDAVEDTAGSDKCESTSVVVGSGTSLQPPVLALTGPSQAMLFAYAGLAMVAVGLGSIAIGRRAEN